MVPGECVTGPIHPWPVQSCRWYEEPLVLALYWLSCEWQGSLPASQPVPLSRHGRSPVLDVLTPRRDQEGWGMPGLCWAWAGCGHLPLPWVQGEPGVGDGQEQDPPQADQEVSHCLWQWHSICSNLFPAWGQVCRPGRVQGGQSEAGLAVVLAKKLVTN